MGMHEWNWWIFHTVAGRNPAPVDMVNFPLFTTFIHPRWLFGFSEPSTVYSVIFRRSEVSGNESPPYFVSPLDFVERHGTQEVVEIRYPTPQGTLLGRILPWKGALLPWWVLNLHPPPSTLYPFGGVMFIVYCGGHVESCHFLVSISWWID